MSLVQALPLLLLLKNVDPVQISNGNIQKNPFYGLVGYTNGLATDRPLGFIRVNYASQIRPARCIAGIGTTTRRPGGLHKKIPSAWPAASTCMEDKRDATRTMYRRNRYYDPGTGRFTQEDPIGLAGGINLYGFANGDPVNFSDPFGLYCEPWPECGTGALASPGLFDPVLLIAGGIAGGIRSLFTRAVARIAAADATATAAIPTASNPALQRTISALFRPGDRIAGGTAGAIRLEATTGQAVGGRFHFQKGIERIQNLENILRREELSAADRALADRVLSDLRSAVQFAQEMARRAAR